MGENEIAHLVDIEAARLGDVRRLKQRVFRRNVRIEAGGRSGQGVGGQRPDPAFRAPGLDAAFTLSISALLVGPRLEPPELSAL